MRALETARVALRGPLGDLLGYVKLTATSEASFPATAAIVELEETEAAKHGESTLQLRESERYEYQVEVANGADLRIRCSLAKRRRSLGLTGSPDAGLIETRSFCGTLVIEVVEGPVDFAKVAVGSALIDVRSLKLDYRTEYRGMIRRMADELAALATDSRSSTKTSFISNFKVRADPGWLQLQLELLREIFESDDFAAALQRIITYPHERLSTALNSSPIDQPIKWTAQNIRQLASGTLRKELDEAHPLRHTGLSSVPSRINIAQHFRDIDTSENRFVKHVLIEFRNFAASAVEILDSPGWGASKALALRLQSSVENWLGRAMFQKVGDMKFAPLGSSVLQRKAGYREILRWWLRSRTAAELSWQGSEDVFRAGQRDVASLYEYWLFFVLLGWFCKTCCNDERPPVEVLIDGLDSSSPNLKLRKKVELGPFFGTIDGSHRSLSAKFSYNRRFGATTSCSEPGSWTRALHPDYTFSFWPSSFTEQEAEAMELIVHIHFDAKYRIESIESLFGGDLAGEEETGDGNYKRQDLMKMHAYRDAIKRSQGAYVIYPGRVSSAVHFSKSHEILPGIGAFSIAPDETGQAQGLETLESFMQEVLCYLTNRSTSLEQASYHTHQSYSDTWRSLTKVRARWSELDTLYFKKRSVPPAEHVVSIVCVPTVNELDWCRNNYSVPVRLSTANGSSRMHRDLASSLHLAVAASISTGAFELWKVLSPAFQIVTGDVLATMGYDTTEPDSIYALFEASVDVEWSTVRWSKKEVARAIRAHLRQREKLQQERLPSKDINHLYSTTLLELLNQLKATV